MESIFGGRFADVNEAIERAVNSPLNHEVKNPTKNIKLFQACHKAIYNLIEMLA